MGNRHKSKKRNSGHGRHTPKSVQPGHTHAIGVDPFKELVSTSIPQANQDGTMINALMWASFKLWEFKGIHEELLNHPDLTADELPPFQLEFLDACLRYPAEGVQTCVTAFTIVGDEQTRSHAKSVQRQLVQRGFAVPEWASNLGELTAVSAFHHADVWGDQESVIIEFASPQEMPALGVLIDYLMSGQAKDVFFTFDVEDVRADMRSHAQREERAIYEEIDVNDALDRIQAAMSTSRLFNGNAEDRTDDYAESAALVWAILRANGRSDEFEWVVMTDEEQETLLEEFLSGFPSSRSDTEMMRRIAEDTIKLRCMAGEDPLRWSPNIVEEILEYRAPRKLTWGREESRLFLEVLPQYVKWAATKTGLAERHVEPILQSIEESTPAFRNAMRNPIMAGPGKLIATAIEQQDIDVTDRDQLDALMNTINANGGIDSLFPSPDRPQRRRAVSKETPAPSYDAIEHAVLLNWLNEFAAFYEVGRTVTKTGNPTLADCRLLIAHLGLPDKMEWMLGGTVSKARSIDNLPQLALVARLAKGAGVVRRTGNKLIATKKWLGMKPADRFLAVANHLFDAGFASFRYDGSYGIFTAFAESVDDAVPAFFDELFERGLVSFEDAAQDVADSVIAAGWQVSEVWTPDSMASTAQNIFISALELMERCGILTWQDFTEKPSRYGGGTDRSGGNLNATDLGRWWWHV